MDVVSRSREARELSVVFLPVSSSSKPYSTDATMNTNLHALLTYSGLTHEQIEQIVRNALELFPNAASRLKQLSDKAKNANPAPDEKRY